MLFQLLDLFILSPMQFRKNKGITVAEILVVVAVIVVILSISFSSFIDLKKAEGADKAALLAVSILDQARSLTLASKTSSEYGVHFASSTITLFTGVTYFALDPSNQVNTLSSVMQTSAVNLTTGGFDIIFDRLTGGTSNSGIVVFSLRADATVTKTVTMYKTGIAQSN